ncbi:MAG TPA: FGGY family carbohydrate kinase, partial [Mycobacterium sp.]|nr:FGGY family carbohydrate kinase [Mycobacterium sp.]
MPNARHRMGWDGHKSLGRDLRGRSGHSSVSSLLLGVDIGTASSKGVLVRDDGTVVATASRAHEVSMPHPGWVEHDAQAVWWRSEE